MILFKKIRWKNLLSTGNSFTEIDLNREGSTLIIGENGAGKSTILDALSFVLYGKPFRNINKGLLVNTINQKSMEVQIEFITNNRTYLVKRGSKPTIFEIYQDGQMIDQNAEQKEYQEMFEKQILKLNSKSFNQIVILGSASFTPFMQLSAPNRREIIEDLLDIQIFSKMNNLLKDKVTKNKQDIVEAGFTVKSLEDKIQMHKEFERVLKENDQQVIEQHKVQISNLEEDNVKFQSIVDIKDSEYIKLEKEEQTLLKKLKKQTKLKDMKYKVELKVSKIKDDISFFHDNDDCPTCKQQITDEFKKETVEDKHKQIKELKDGINQIQQEINNIDPFFKEHEQLTAKMQLINVEKDNVQADIKVNKKLISNYKDEIKRLESTKVEEDKEINDLPVWKKDLEFVQQQQEKLQKDKQVLEVAGLLLKDTGIKTKIIKQYIPVINKLINKYLASMDFFVNFELNENFEETIKSRFRDAFTYESFSEGEKMRIDLALLFTWRSIAKLRNSASTNLLIMDEVFDSSLDNSGTDEFMKIINALTNDNNMFIISHKGDQLFDKFHNVIKFEKHKNFSRIAK